MNSERLEALAERCEQASGPDRELDREIKELVGHAWDYGVDWDYRDSGTGMKASQPVAKPYTASLDAAMSLARDDSELSEWLDDAIEHTATYGWTKGDYKGQLTRNFVGQALRALATKDMDDGRD